MLEDERQAQAKSAPVPPSVPSPPAFEKALKDSDQKLQQSVKEKDRSKLERDVQQVIRNRKTKKTMPVNAPPIPLDDIEKMMIEYNISTPAEIQKRHEELKAIK